MKEWIRDHKSAGNFNQALIDKFVIEEEMIVSTTEFYIPMTMNIDREV